MTKQRDELEEMRERVKAEIPKTERFYGRLFWDCVRMLREERDELRLLIAEMLPNIISSVKSSDRYRRWQNHAK